MTENSHHRRKLTTVLVALVVGLFGSGFLVWNASNAAFSSTTVNPSNSWAAGSVALTDDDSGTAMFNASGMTPTTPVINCITVTYNGTVTSPIKLYGAAPGGTGLAPYLNLTVEIGTGGGFNSCAGFSPSSTIFNNTLASFGSTYTNYANGLATTWSPTGSGQSKVFRFTAQVADNNAAAGLTCTMPFTWEAQS
jgi:hypothetical protein